MQALVFVGDAMEDLPTFTPASLACRYFCQEGDDPDAAPSSTKSLNCLARPKRFELLTPRFVV